MNNPFKKSCWCKEPEGYEQITKGRREWADNYKGKNYEMKSLVETRAECVCVCVRSVPQLCPTLCKLHGL